MRAFVAILLVGCVAARSIPLTNSASTTSSKQAFFDRRGWTQLQSAPEPDDLVRLTIAVKHRNVESLHQIWWDIANPLSKNYAKYLTAEALHGLIGPDPTSVPTILSWLQTANPASIKVATHEESIIAQVTVQAAEKLLGVRITHFRHEYFAPGRVVSRSAEPVVVPSHLQAHIDLIAGLSDFSHPFSHRAHRKPTLATTKSRISAGVSDAPFISFLNNGNNGVQIQFQPTCETQGPAPYYYLCTEQGFKNVTGFQVQTSFQDHSLDTTQVIPVASASCETEREGRTEYVVSCSIYVSNIVNWHKYNVSLAVVFVSGSTTDFGAALPSVVNGPWALPHVIKRLYNITQCDEPKDVPNDSVSTGGVILFEYQYYSPGDLSTFLLANNLPNDTAALVAPTDPNQPAYPGEEGQADIELLSANGVGGKQSTYWYSTDGGDGVLQWALQIAGTPDAQTPKVWSLSWGISETEFDEAVGDGAQERIDLELQKMGTRGLTIVIASGDAGVRPVGRSVPDCGVFEPDYPASSQYVLTVGATMLVQPDDSIVSKAVESSSYPVCDLPMSGSTESHISCDETGLDTAMEVSVSCCDGGAVWTAGAGFSNNYTRASWQANAVQSFLNLSADSLPPSSLWNVNGRAYPDITMIGDKVPVYRSGALDNFGGTSASAPLAAALVTLLNAERLARGLPFVGPITPLFYAIAEKYPDSAPFNDITIGQNRCGELQCCDHGFECTKGWDAVTGLGSPNYVALKTLILKDLRSEQL